MSEQNRAFAKYDLQGEDLAHRIISGAVKASATEQAYALLWLAEREKERHPPPGADEGPGTAHAAVRAQHLAARAAVHSAKAQERAANSARIVNTLALVAIGVSIFAVWSEGQKDRASIQKIAVSAVQTVSDILGQL